MTAVLARVDHRLPPPMAAFEASWAGSPTRWRTRPAKFWNGSAASV
ncbi:MAG: hypothetical protein ACLRWQ_12750 [Flavonifractor plautii]